MKRVYLSSILALIMAFSLARGEDRAVGANASSNSLVASPPVPAVEAKDANQLGVISTTTYRTYNNVHLISVTPLGLNATWDGGLGLIDFQILPPELQRKYGYDKAKYNAAKSAQVNHDAQSDAAVQATYVQKNQDEALSEVIQKAKKIAVSGKTYPRGKVASVIPLDSEHNALLISIYGLEDYPSGVMIVVAGLNGQYADGDWIEGTPFYYAGVTHYMSVAGASVTARVYSPSLEWAIRNLLDHSK